MLAHGAPSGLSPKQLVFRGVLGSIRSEIATATALASSSSSSSSSAAAAAAGGRGAPLTAAAPKDVVSHDPAVSDKVGALVVTTFRRIGLHARDDDDDVGNSSSSASAGGAGGGMAQLKHVSKNFSRLLMMSHKKAASKDVCPVLVAILGEVGPSPPAHAVLLLCALAARLTSSRHLRRCAVGPPGNASIRVG